MRFCTTHRACESDDEGLCLVGWTAREAARQLDASEPTRIYVWLCTLVDALIVAKEDGEWPAWAEGNAAEAISYDAPNTAGVEVLDWMLRMQVLAAKETP